MFAECLLAVVASICAHTRCVHVQWLVFGRAIMFVSCRMPEHAFVGCLSLILAYACDLALALQLHLHLHCCLLLRCIVVCTCIYTYAYTCTCIAAAQLLHMHCTCVAFAFALDVVLSFASAFAIVSARVLALCLNSCACIALYCDCRQGDMGGLHWLCSRISRTPPYLRACYGRVGAP